MHVFFVVNMMNTLRGYLHFVPVKHLNDDMYFSSFKKIKLWPQHGYIKTQFVWFEFNSKYNTHSV